MAKDDTNSNKRKKKSGRKEPSRISDPSIRVPGSEDLGLSLDATENTGFVKKQLSRLKSKVDDISKVPKKERLSDSQIEVLRKYIEVKELEVRDLKDQKDQYRGHVERLSAELDMASHKNRDLIEKRDDLAREKGHIKSELEKIAARYEKKLAAIKSDYEDKLAAFQGYDNKIKELKHEKEEWKDKVRGDLKKIKLKEKEIENKYELLKRDAQALLDSKDRHVLDLKKKNDSLEMELEGAEEKLRSNAMALGLIESKKRRLVETLKLAISLLEDIDKDSPSDPVEKKKAS